jgi:hypothetical protein
MMLLLPPGITQWKKEIAINATFAHENPTGWVFIRRNWFGNY